MASHIVTSGNERVSLDSDISATNFYSTRISGQSSLSALQPLDSNSGLPVLQPVSPADLESRAQDTLDFLYTADSRTISSPYLNPKVDSRHGEIMENLEHDQPEHVRQARASIDYRLGGLVVNYDDPNALANLAEALEGCSDEAGLLQRLYGTLGAQRHNLLSDVRVWKRIEEGSGSSKNVAFERVYPKPKKDEGATLQTVVNGKISPLYGHYRTLEEQGVIFDSTSQLALESQDPDGWYISPDELLYRSAKNDLLQRGDRQFLERNLDLIHRIYPHLKGKSVDDLVRGREKLNPDGSINGSLPSLAGEFSRSAEIAIYSPEGKMVGMLKANHRMENVANLSASKVFEDRGMGTVVRRTFEPGQLETIDHETRDWIVDTYMRARIAEADYMFERNKDGSLKRPQFSIPLVEEVEPGDGSGAEAFNRGIHVAAQRKRFNASQVLADNLIPHSNPDYNPVTNPHPENVVGDLEDLIDEEERREIISTLTKKFLGVVRARDFASTLTGEVPLPLSVPGIVSSRDESTLLARMLIPHMQNFPEVLDRVQEKYGLQKPFTRKDLGAIIGSSEATVNDRIAEVGFLEAVNIVAEPIHNLLTREGGVLVPEVPLTSYVSVPKRRDTLKEWEFGDSKVTSDDPLGTGAMGVVVEGFNHKHDVPSAIKVVNPGLLTNPLMLSRFYQEGRLGSKLRNDNIIRVYGHGGASPFHFIDMEHLSGGDLTSKMEEWALEDPEIAVRVLNGITNALEYTDSKGVVHRDIKPDNIMFDENGRPVLVDFGVAFEEGVTKEQPDTIVGTLHYMSPEQIRSGEPDVSFDIYSLGMSLRHSLTGVLPFDTEKTGNAGLADLFRQISGPQGPKYSINERRKFAGLEPVEDELCDLIDGMIIKDPRKRIRSIRRLKRRIKPLTT